MIVQRIDLFHISIPLTRPFTTGFGTIKERPALIIRMVTDEGLIGYGESSPLYFPMSEPETVVSGLALLKKILPTILDLPLDPSVDITQKYRGTDHSVSLLGIEGAYLDLLAQMEKKPLYELFGAVHRRIPAGESVGIKKSLQETLNEVDGYVKQGIRRIKIKVAPGHDIEFLKAVRDAFPRISLGADANAAYAPDQLSIVAKFADFNLSFVEQPFGADDFKTHASLKKYGVPVCLDETVRDLATCRRAIDEGVCDMVNIKPARIGSFREAKEIHDLCLDANIKLFGGGRLETGLGKTVNAHFYALPGFTEPSDITPPSQYFETDVIDPPFSITSGFYEPSDRPGVGVEIRDGIIRQFLREQFTFVR